MGVFSSGIISPADLGNLDVWLKADAITGLTDGQALTTWTDSSGKGRDYTQGTAGNKPTYRVSSINGQPGVRFDGIDDYLSRAIVFLQPATIFVVASHSSEASGVDDTLFDSGGGNTMRLYAANADSWRLHIQGGLDVSSGTSVVLNTPFVASGIFDSTRSRVSMNGAVGNQINAGTATPASASYIGVFGTPSAAFWPGDISEYILYNTALDLESYDKVLKYLGNKYNVSVPQRSSTPPWVFDSPRPMSSFNSSGRVGYDRAPGAGHNDSGRVPGADRSRGFDRPPGAGKGR